MSAEMINGAELSKVLRAKIKERVDILVEKGVLPGLEVILVGNDPASESYVKNKYNCAIKLGIRSGITRMPENVSEDEIINVIKGFNENPAVHGILVQLPLPGGQDESRVLDAISPDKDVDGLHIYNAGCLALGKIGFVPCTPKGIIEMLDSIGCDPQGKHAVVVGRSNLVGRPVAMLLTQRNATVTLCHSKTKDLGSFTKQADILICAAGKRNLITGDMVKAGAVVIDVSMNRVDGKWHGDTDFDAVSEKASYMTPVPGGVGPMTITMLMENTVLSAENTL